MHPVLNAYFHNITFNPPVLLNASETYCFVFRVPNTGLNMRARYDDTSPSFSGGHYCYTPSGDSGWTAYTGRDFYAINLYGYNASETMLTTSGQSVISDLAYNMDQGFGLKIEMPTSSSTGTNQSTTLTFEATVD